MSRNLMTKLKNAGLSADPPENLYDIRRDNVWTRNSYRDLMLYDFVGHIITGSNSNNVHIALSYVRSTRFTKVCFEI